MNKWFIPLSVLFTAEFPEPRAGPALRGFSTCPQMRGLTYSPGAGGSPPTYACPESTRPDLAEPLTVPGGWAHGAIMHGAAAQRGAEVGQDQLGQPWSLERFLPPRNSGL